MKSTTYLTWFKRLLVLGAVVGIGALASSAGAVGRPPDVQDAAATLHSPPADVVERYAATHQSGSGTQSRLVSRPPDVQDVASSMNAAAPDVIERFVAVHPYDLGLPSGATDVTRPPDISDTALAVRYGSIVQSKGFDWGDWAIGIGSGMGLALLLGAVLLMGRQLRRGVQTA